MKGIFVVLPMKLDRFFSRIDYQVHKLCWLDRENAHFPEAWIFGLMTLIFLIWGPIPQGISTIAVTIFLGGTGLMAALSFVFKNDLTFTSHESRLSSWFRHHYVFAAQGLTILTVSAVIWFTPGLAGDSEAVNSLYRHGLIPVMLILLTLIPVAKCLAHCLFPGPDINPETRFRFSAVLGRTDLVFSPREPHISCGKIFMAFFNAPVTHAVYLVYLPALAVILIKNEQYMHWVAGVLLFLSLLFLLCTGIHTRYASILRMIRRVLFCGAQLFISLLIIALAAGRLAGISYITTVIESISSTSIIFFYLCSLYSIFWFYEYWINRALTENLLNVLRQDRPLRAGIIEYELSDGHKRRIQVNGAARFVAVDPDPDIPFSGLKENITIYDRLPLFKRIVEGAGSPVEARIALQEIVKRYYFYFVFLTALGVLLFGLFIGKLHSLPQLPEYRQAEKAPAGGHVDLAGLLLGQKDGAGVILLSASGGGTRAALYTASVLRGLRRLNALHDVKLVSGVSGGGAALAYFGAHYKELAESTDDKPWERFSDVMAKPFIQDVLEGSMEWRILKNTRLGELLKESFQRHFYQGENLNKTFGDVAENARLGIILNTALAGHPYYITDLFNGQMSRRGRSSSIYKGGRLIFTNLSSKRPMFNGEPLFSALDQGLKYVVEDSPATDLATAAALNANFPPVFSNAAVDIVNSQGGYDRYWVTDGGAMDNRGTISLLLALETALKKYRDVRPAGIPPLNIIIADASAETVDYHQSRGIATSLGASTSIANRLIRELVEKNMDLYTEGCGGRAEDFNVYYLGMPEPFRIRGGMGTHWMLPAEISMVPVKHPDRKLDEKEKVTLKNFQVKQLINKLHQPRAELNALAEKDEDMKKAVNMMLESPHREVWKNLAKQISQGRN